MFTIMVFNEISYLINDFPYPPSYLPRPLIHEKCLDNPIHDPNLFDKTVSEYFSSVMENEKNDNDMIRMEINVNPVSRGKVQEKSSLRKELSFNESVDSFNKSNVNIHAESCGSIVSHIEKSQSVVVFPLEKIKLFIVQTKFNYI
ncbi:hypothetical protein BCR36DRAFT_43616 [Piromyces finnis]|uniref:Uncharacterized protein n=1 Tax=Piromyces finnis TaxID=1754191 RepID=A0A1Y1UC05_9FUNG|nr:hypothetical protein BCR36DRAFT_43616 [Piromyces finnis]|eukprot:ORX34615.1 hypothetical protein BCR36DRAFT_43616 [Piromyces finnis]